MHPHPLTNFCLLNQMGVQGALVGTVTGFAVPQILHIMGVDVAGILQRIPPFDGPYGGAFAATVVVPLAGGVVGYYYL